MTLPRMATILALLTIAFPQQVRAQADASWWSLQPVERPALPAVEDHAWPRNAIDYFVLAELEAAGLRPAPEADASMAAEDAAPAMDAAPDAEPASAAPDASEIEAAVLAIVADKTGYPEDMLDLDLDLEADLGIDTVKQAEMFAPLRERYGIERDENLQLRDYPTLTHVVGFVVDRLPAVEAGDAPESEAGA